MHYVVSHCTMEIFASPAWRPSIFSENAMNNILTGDLAISVTDELCLLIRPPEPLLIRPCEQKLREFLQVAFFREEPLQKVDWLFQGRTVHIDEISQNSSWAPHPLRPNTMIYIDPRITALATLNGHWASVIDMPSFLVRPKFVTSTLESADGQPAELSPLPLLHRQNGNVWLS